MKKYTFPFILAFILGLFLIQLMATTPSQASPNQQTSGETELPSGISIITSPQMQEGIVSTSLQGIFGPNICTIFGDPFSPLNSPWAPGAYTFHYRIEIPADYPHDVLRVEIFDPDSINNENNTATILRTDAAVQAGETSTTSGYCTYYSRLDACFIETGEAPAGNPIGGLEFDQINPLWYMRVDQNRGSLTPGECGRPQVYTEAYNTATHFQLSYYQDMGDGSTQEIALASYTGQTGQEAIDHETDLHWVSPGADISFGWDKDVPGIDVPADLGTQTAHGFEIDLTTEVPNIVTDPNTGHRDIYISVTALSGSSKNSFEFWAGSPNHVNDVPSNVNARNVYALNNPGAHSSDGVNIYALGYLPQQSNIDGYRVDKPLIYLTPEQAGDSVFVSLFDADTLAESPITFYLDTIPKEDWSLTFGAGGIDPDGITSTVRCQFDNMGCNNLWIDPPYEIKLPNGTKDCDFSNPSNDTCTPFYGGRLIAEHQGGRADTYGWEISVSQNETPNPYSGCDAFPIIIYEGIRSVHDPAGSPDGNAYPAISDFQGPDNPRTYESFLHHRDNVDLVDAAEGTVFKVQNGAGPGQLGWLQWNDQIIPSAATLNDSLTWPGNTYDYTTNPPRGFIEVGDPTDQSMGIGDYVAAGPGAVSASFIFNTLEDHINLGRSLRLLIYSDPNERGGANGAYKITRFGIFRLHGYSFSSTGTWLLLEFIRWDTSCGQYYNVIPLTEVTIDGATFAAPNENVIFDAAIAPLDATKPVTYTWSTTDHAPLTHLNTLSDTITFNWTMTGTKTITVTAENAGSIITDTHTIVVSDLVNGQDLVAVGAPQLVTPLPLLANTPLEFEVTVKNLGYVDVNTEFFVDLFVNPTTINPDGIPLAQSSGSIAVDNLAGGESKTVNITLPAGLPVPNGSHQIYAMVDASQNIEETEETNNVSPAASIHAQQMLQPPNAVDIVGSTFSLFHEDVVFTAKVTPLTANQPLSYTWEATDFAPITQSNNLTDTISFNWATTGNKTITVTAENAASVVTTTHNILISDLVQGQDLVIDGAPQLITPLPIEEGEPLEFAVTVKNMGDTAVSSQAFIDLFVNPNAMYPDGIPPEQSKGFSILYDLDPGASKTINVTLPNGLTKPNSTHQIYAMIDTFKSIAEVDESNNISAPLAFDASNFAQQKYIYLPMIIKN